MKARPAIRKPAVKMPRRRPRKIRFVVQEERLDSEMDAAGEWFAVSDEEVDVGESLGDGGQRRRGSLRQGSDEGKGSGNIASLGQ